MEAYKQKKFQKSELVIVKSRRSSNFSVFVIRFFERMLGHRDGRNVKLHSRHNKLGLASKRRILS